MALILHFSDLHLLARPREQEIIFEELLAALAHVQELAHEPVGLLAITGDIFDSATLPVAQATRRFCQLHAAVCDALHRDVPTVIVPGNHDRRRNGLVGPHRDELFLALRNALGPRAWVHGCNAPLLCEVVPPEYHNLPLWVVAYDSSFLPRGLFSAGGALRQEDLLYTAAQLAGREPAWPVLFLLHHHLVPTPLTDLGPIELEQAPRILRWGVQQLLPALVAHADREELTMTALGAGTALSTLHSLGRSVLAIHGHKHYATARMLEGMWEGDGDVLLVSAGSTGLAQRWHDHSSSDSARLWPSFNVIALEGDVLSIDTVSFAWKREGSARSSRRALLRARRSGSQWQITPVSHASLEDPGPRLQLNAARCWLRPSLTYEDRWDYSCERRLCAPEGTRLHRYLEEVSGLSDGLGRHEGTGSDEPLPMQLALQIGRDARYSVVGGLFRTLSRARRTLGVDTAPFATVSLLNRYYSTLSELSVSQLGELASDAFGSATDLGTGLERPVPLERDLAGGSVVLRVTDCPPRTLLRVYFRLQ